MYHLNDKKVSHLPILNDFLPPHK